MENNEPLCSEANGTSPLPVPESPAGGSSIVKTIFEYAEIVVFSVCAVLLAFNLLGRLCRVDGDSMKETLHHGELLITTSIGTPDRGDIVVFHQTTNGDSVGFNEPLVKRVIAKGGDTVCIDYTTSTVYINGEELNEPYAVLISPNGIYDPRSVPDYGYQPLSGIFEVTVPDGCYFVMGDNRNHSSDSRTAQIGFVDGRRILGRVVLRTKPFTLFN